MEEEWIVRVQGQEYGPVGPNELREWRSEGRLIPTNEVRRVGEERWIQAGELPEVFGDVSEAVPTPAPSPMKEIFVRPWRWREILGETFRIYQQGFWRFMLLGLVTSVPMAVMQLTFPRIPIPNLGAEPSAAISIPPISPLCKVMVLLVLLVWPISAAGFQFVAADILGSHSNSLGAQVSKTFRYWARMLGAGLLVYGSFFFWTFLPLQAMLAFANGANLLLGLLMIVLIGGFMVYIVARLFINFLFWQQTTALGNQQPFQALRESKELARSLPDAPRFERPLYRGAIAASIWLVLLLVVTYSVQLPFAMARLSGVANLEEAVALMKKVTESPSPDFLLVAAEIASAIVYLLLRPLLAIVFVILYFDAKARSGTLHREPSHDES